MTKVKFLIEETYAVQKGWFIGKNEDVVFAFFPEDNFTHNKTDGLFSCYAHVGQHSSCHIDYANECKEAKYNEYADLLKELIGQGYKDLQIMNKQEIEAHRPPTTGEQCFGHGAIHRLSVNLANVINKQGNIKKWFVWPGDGLRYSTR